MIQLLQAMSSVQAEATFRAQDSMKVAMKAAITESMEDFMQKGMMKGFQEAMQVGIQEGLQAGLKASTQVIHDEMKDFLQEQAKVSQEQAKVFQDEMKGLLMQQMQVSQGQTKVLKDVIQESMEGLGKRVVKAVDEVQDELKRNCQVMKGSMKDVEMEVKRLKGTKVGGVVKEATLWEVSDRCDKAGNKLEVIERRLERLVMDSGDTERHLCQVLQEWNHRIAPRTETLHGLRVDRTVGLRWIMEIEENWRTARHRLLEDSSKVAWRQVMRQAGERTMKEATACIWEAEKALKAISAVLEGDKSEDETSQEWEARQAKAIQDGVWYKDQLEEADRWKVNVENYFQDILQGNSAKEQADWEAHKEAVKARMEAKWEDKDVKAWDGPKV